MAISVKVLFCLSAVAHSSLSCSAPFALTNSVCVFFSTHRATWCDAQHYCQQVGGELLTGDMLLLGIQNSIFDTSYYYWVGITDLDEERISSTSGWKWTNGSVAPNDLPWSSKPEPDGTDNQDCASIKQNSIFDYYCDKINYFICQPSSAFSPKTEMHFVKTDLLVSSIANANQNAGGACMRNYTVTHQRYCAARCLQAGSCVSFYFNRERFACVLVLFTDSRVDVGSPDGWRKFVNTK